MTYILFSLPDGSYYRHEFPEWFVGNIWRESFLIAPGFLLLTLNFPGKSLTLHSVVGGWGESIPAAFCMYDSCGLRRISRVCLTIWLSSPPHPHLTEERETKTQASDVLGLSRWTCSCWEGCPWSLDILYAKLTCSISGTLCCSPLFYS